VLFDGGVSMERSGCGAIKEGEEDARLFRENLDGPEGPKMDQIEEFVYRCGCG